MWPQATFVLFVVSFFLCTVESIPSNISENGILPPCGRPKMYTSGRSSDVMRSFLPVQLRRAVRATIMLRSWRAAELNRNPTTSRDSFFFEIPSVTMEQLLASVPAGTA